MVEDWDSLREEYEKKKKAIAKEKKNRIFPHSEETREQRLEAKREELRASGITAEKLQMQNFAMNQLRETLSPNTFNDLYGYIREDPILINDIVRDLTEWNIPLSSTNIIARLSEIKKSSENIIQVEDAPKVGDLCNRCHQGRVTKVEYDEENDDYIVTCSVCG